MDVKRVGCSCCRHNLVYTKLNKTIRSPLPRQQFAPETPELFLQFMTLKVNLQNRLDLESTNKLFE